MNKIPVFLHIPKNAGTYVLGVTMEMFRHYGIINGWRNELNWNLNLRRILLQKNGNQIATLFVYDPKKIRNTNLKFKSLSNDNHCNIIDTEDFLNELKHGQLIIFSIIIEDHGTKYIKDDLYKTICETANVLPFYYTILRNPFERALSLYNYIISPESCHESTHNIFVYKTFTDYVRSYHLEDSWLIRNLNIIPEEKSITEEDFSKTCYLLNNFVINDISCVDELLNETFSICYGVTKNSFPDVSFNVNKNITNKKNKTTFDKLDEETKKIFLERTEFDRKIYQKYCCN